jgi:hypothetical protein
VWRWRRETVWRVEVKRRGAGERCATLTFDADARARSTDEQAAGLGRSSTSLMPACERGSLGGEKKPGRGEGRGAANNYNCGS